MHGVSAHANYGYSNYLSALFSTPNPILSVINLSRLECVETAETCMRLVLACGHTSAVLSTDMTISGGFVKID